MEDAATASRRDDEGDVRGYARGGTRTFMIEISFLIWLPMFCFWIFSLSRILIATFSPVSVLMANLTCRDKRRWRRLDGEAVRRRALPPNNAPRWRDASATPHLAESALAQRAADLIAPDALNLRARGRGSKERW